MNNLRISPDTITELQFDQVFVFGSNTNGIHGKGAALLAKEKFGAQPGNPRGIQGRSYAIPTRELVHGVAWYNLSLTAIQKEVDAFIQFAREHPELEFLVTQIGCGLGGKTPNDIAPLFYDAMSVGNIYLPQSFWTVLIEEALERYKIKEQIENTR